MNCERCDRIPGLPVLCATCQRNLLDLERERAAPVVGPPVYSTPINVSPFTRFVRPGYSDPERD